MGVVYKARQVELNRVVALKMILAGVHASPDDLARFYREARAVARLRHPNIIQVHDIGTQDGQPYFALEYVEGGSLADRLTGKPWGPRKAATLVQTLARAIHAAHRQKIIHRDLKPANVLLTDDDAPKITDFGLAKRLDDRATGNTQTGSILGTPAYMAPEQADGRKDIGPPADVYALGAILYELLTGRPPFQAATPLDTILKVLSVEPVPPSRLRPTLDRDLEAICLKCLEKEPARRYASARALANDLNRFLDGEPIQARGRRTWERTVKWLGRKRLEAALVFVSTLACLLLAAVVFLLVRAQRAPQSQALARVPNEPQSREEPVTPPRNKDGKDPEVPRPEAAPKKDQPLKVPPTAKAPAVGVPIPVPLDCTGADGVRAAEVRRSQEAWARYLGRQVEETVEVANGVKMTFVLIPPGKFRMGSPQDEKDRDKDEELHEVTLTEPFYLGKTEVTQAQYEALTGDNPSQLKGADRPVELVSWNQARDYAAQLTKKRHDQHVYRLPTEAEWEYCCRGGRSSFQPFGVGDGRAISSREANFDGKFPYGGADKGPSLASTCRVGSYPGNALGLFDMHGNVSEWCADWSGPYPAGAVTNPTGPKEGSVRVVRGGCWIYGARICRAADRSWSSPLYRNNSLGFRLARSVPSGDR
jgi:serine/threonine protein kinase/formylglycine-generating enzyme required for sulfatase activity